MISTASGLSFGGDNAPVCLSRLDTGVAVLVNARFLSLHGLAESEVIGRRIEDLGIWERVEERAAIIAAARRGEIVHATDVRMRTVLGSRIMSYSAAPVVVDGATHLLSFSRDVTDERASAAERDRIARELRLSEERCRAILRSVPVVQWATDREGVFTLSEGRGLAALGLEPGQVVGRTLSDVYGGHPGIVADHLRAQSGESFTAINDFGAVVFESHWGPLRDASGAVIGVTGIALDVTARRAAEAAQRESDGRLHAVERLAAMGQAAAGLAHEVNNPLTYVLANLDSALERIAEPTVHGQLLEARTGAERIREIVRDLSVFARARPALEGVADVAGVVQSAVAFTRNELRHRARVTVQVATARHVAMSEGRLAQALVNLLSNAAHALPEGQAAAHTVKVVAWDAADEVVLEVTDTGTGMPPEVMARVFEPFFTTRVECGGMGMGLALTRAFVEQAGGTIEVESEPLRGATFRITLPAVSPPARPARQAAQRPIGRARVLIIDDDPLVGKAIARLLRGHETVVATSAASAIETLRGGEVFDALFCDLMMPEMTGMDLYQLLLAERPEVAARVIFLTGGAFTLRAQLFVEDTRSIVLTKPIDAKTLRDSLSMVVSGARAPAGCAT